MFHQCTGRLSDWQHTSRSIVLCVYKITYPAINQYLLISAQSKTKEFSEKLPSEI